MSSNDVLHRFLFDHSDIRGEIVSLDSSYREVLSHKDYPPAVQRLLGEFLAAASLLSSTLKFDGLISLQAKGSGPVSTIMAECTHHNTLRGIVRLNPEQPLGVDTASNGTLPQLLGNGVMAITIEPERGERYQGIVPMDSEHLAGCLEHYFQQSEQLATRLWFAADGNRCSGLLLQALPRQLEADADANQDRWETLCALADTVTPIELLTVEHSDLIYRLFHEQAPRLFEPQSLNFGCSCSEERSANALLSLGREEVEQLLVETGGIDIDCQFCNRHYHFDAAAVRSLLGDATLH